MISENTLSSNQLNNEEQQEVLKTEQKENNNPQTVQQEKQNNPTETSNMMEERSFSSTKRLNMHSEFKSDKVRNTFKSLNVKELAEQYKKKNIKISTLSIPQYVDMINESTHSKVETIHFLPPVLASSIEKFSFNKDKFGNMNTNNNNISNQRDFTMVDKIQRSPNFLNDDEIKFINQNIVDLLDNSLQTTRQNWNRYNNSLFSNPIKSCRSYQSSPRNSIFSRISTNLAKKEVIRLQLEHNKSQLESAIQYSIGETKKKFSKEIQFQEDFKKKIDSLPPIKNYASRGKILENMMHMQMIKQIHQANGHELSEKDNKNNNQSSKQIDHVSSRVSIPKTEMGVNVLKIQYKGFWVDNENKGWKPPARETSRSAILGDKGYCYGGVGMEVLNDFCMINFQTKDWEILPMKGEYPKDGRYGHSLEVYKKQLIIFGGEKKQSAQAKLKELLNEVRILNLDNYEWKILRCSGDWIEPRRDHASAMVGRNLFVHGGISQRNFNNDLFFLDIQFNRWQEASCQNTAKIYPEGVAYHTACAVFFQERKNIQIYRSLEDKYSDKFNRLKEEGVYFFGGVNLSGSTNNTFAILKTDTKPMHFIIPETMGEPPKRRCKHSMTLQTQLEWVVIYGGINEESGEDGFINEMHMLKLDTLIWRQITFYGIEKVGRCGHLCMSYQTQILIIGGLGAQGIFSMGAQEVELAIIFFIKKDQKNVLKLYQQEVRYVEQNNRKRQNSFIDKNLQGKIIKIKQDLNKNEQAMELQIKIIESHKESVSRLLKKLQFKNQNSFLPIPQQMNDLNHMTSLLMYQNTTSFDEEKQKKKQLINKQAEQFNKEDDTLNANLKLTSESFNKSEKSPEKTPDLKNKIKKLINMKKLVDLKFSNTSLNIKLNENYSEKEYSKTPKMNPETPKQDQYQSGFTTPQYSKIIREGSFSLNTEENVKRQGTPRASRRSISSVTPKAQQ